MVRLAVATVRPQSGLFFLLITPQGRVESLLIFLLTQEMKRTATAEVLFRSDTFAVKAITSYLKSHAQGYVASLRPFVIYAADLSALECEIADDRLTPSANLNENLSNLLQLLSYALSCMLSSAPSCPPHIKRLFFLIRSAVLSRFPSEPSIDLRGICSFLFLRLFVPALIVRVPPLHPSLTPIEPS